MAHITDTLAPHFTGHVGLVRFLNGHAETDDPEAVDYFRGESERYVVTETDEPRGLSDADKAELEALLEPEGWEPPKTLTAEQVLRLAAGESGAEVAPMHDRDDPQE